jgi:plasmid maintenance system killer protein
LDILFASPDLEKLCHDEKLAKRAHGDDVAKKLRSRLDDLRAAPNMAVCSTLPGKFHPLTKDRKGQYAVWLDKAMRLAFEPVARPKPVLPDGSIDLGRIATIRVVFIGNYHD